MLHSLTLRNLHFLLSHILIGHGDSTSVLSHCDFNFLLSMVDGFYLHLRYEAVVSISY